MTPDYKINEDILEEEKESKTKIILEEIFYVLSKKHSVFRVKLTLLGLILSKEGDGNIIKEQLIKGCDILGCKCMRSKRRGLSCTCSSLPLHLPLHGVSGNKGSSIKVVDETSGDLDENDVSAYLYIYAYILKKTRKGGKRERTVVTLRFRSFDSYEDNYKEAQKWRLAIAKISRSEKQVPLDPVDHKKLLIIVNPKSGSGKARELYHRHMTALLNEAEVPHEVLVTEGADHARKFIRSRNLYNYRGIIAAGGDGIFFEMLNGVFEKPDWRQVLREVPLGILPCGSGNGLARTICHLFDEPFTNPMLSCALAAVRGKTSPMHLVRVETNTRIIFSFLSVGWGLLSDIDVESERLRAIGGQRFTIWSIARLIGLRTYKGKVYYRPVAAPAPASSHPVATRLSHSISQDNSLDVCVDCAQLDDSCDTCKTTQISLDTKDEDLSLSDGRRRLDSWYSANSERSAYFSSAGSDYLSIADSSKIEKDQSENFCVYGPAPSLPALTAALPADWICIEGEFILVHAGYQTHLGEDFLFAPDAKLGDDIIWLLIVKGNTTRAQVLQFLLGLSNAAHANPSRQPQNGSIQLIPVSAFRIEPEVKPSHPAFLTVDGEIVSYGAIQAEMCTVKCNLLVPSP